MVVPQVPVPVEYTEPGLEACSLPPILVTRPPYMGLLPPLPGIVAGESKGPPEDWVCPRVAWGLEMTTEFFMLSAEVTRACLAALPPKSLRDEERETKNKTKHLVNQKIRAKQGMRNHVYVYKSKHNIQIHF